MEDEDELKDWEIEEERPPEALERKWEEEERKPRDPIECPSCKQWVSPDSLTCIFCGTSIHQGSGFLQKLLRWLTGR